MRRKLIGILLLGFASGLPYMLVFSTLTAWLRDVGISLTEIGFFAWLVLTYSLKFLWAPFVDRYSVLGFKVFGKRRGWILFSQSVIFLSLIGMSLIDPLPLACLNKTYLIRMHKNPLFLLRKKLIFLIFPLPIPNLKILY